MNTKIKELSQFAGFSSTYEQERLTKFAQLIIHECAHAVAKQGINSIDDISKILKEHFSE
jgi:hypothetical protein